MAQGAVFLAKLVIGLDQVGIDVLFLTLLFALAVGGVFLSLALAFARGAGTFVSNLLGANLAQRAISPGETVRVGEHEGQIVEFTPAAVVLATESGRLVVPGRIFQEQGVLVDHRVRRFIDQVRAAVLNRGSARGPDQCPGCGAAGVVGHVQGARRQYPVPAPRNPDPYAGAGGSRAQSGVLSRRRRGIGCRPPTAAVTGPQYSAASLGRGYWVPTPWISSR